MAKKKTLGSVLTGGFMHLLGCLPLSFHNRMARVIAPLIKGYRADVVYTNIARCFPYKDYSWVKATGKAFYLHLAQIITQTIWFGACCGENGRKRIRKSGIVKVENAAVLESLKEKYGRVVLLLTHSGNWELIGGIKEYMEDAGGSLDANEICVTYKKLDNPAWDAIMEDNRTAPVKDLGFDGYIETASILRYALQTSDRRMVYTFISDQFPYRETSSSLDFFNLGTPVMTGAAALASKLGIPLVYTHFKCRQDGGYILSFSVIEEDARGKDPQEMTEKYYRLLEDDIREQPWNYLWTHKRWKR